MTRPRAIHQLRLNRLTSAASYQAFIVRIMSPICPHCGSGEETAEHLLLSCPWWAVERQCHFSDSIDIKDVFQDYVNLVDFLTSSGHLPPHIGITWWAHHNNNNNNNNNNDNNNNNQTILTCASSSPNSHLLDLIPIIIRAQERVIVTVVVGGQETKSQRLGAFTPLLHENGYMCQTLIYAYH